MNKALAIGEIADFPKNLSTEFKHLRRRFHSFDKYLQKFDVLSVVFSRIVRRAEIIFIGPCYPASIRVVLNH